jgi:hypothetical protein
VGWNAVGRSTFATEESWWNAKEHSTLRLADSLFGKNRPIFVVPAKAGIQAVANGRERGPWTPAFAGVTR